MEILVFMHMVHVVTTVLKAKGTGSFFFSMTQTTSRFACVLHKLAPTLIIGESVSSYCMFPKIHMLNTPAVGEVSKFWCDSSKQDQNLQILGSFQATGFHVRQQECTPKTRFNATHIRHLWFTNSTTQNATQENFVNWCMMGKQATQSFYWGVMCCG
jgi:hypothetical protein